MSPQVIVQNIIYAWFKLFLALVWPYSHQIRIWLLEQSARPGVFLDLTHESGLILTIN
jgi:hypothetical protein